jgi:hypothetical protein
MDKAELKKLLSLSKKQPVNCAVAMGKTGAVIIMDKVKQPKALEKELSKQHPDAKNPRWGTASVDIDEAPKLVVFTLNKASSGLGKGLKKALAGTGFSQVEIRFDDGSAPEKLGDEAEDAEQDGDAPAPPGMAAAPPPPDSPAEPSPPDASAAPPAPPSEDAAAPKAPDAGALTRRLTAAVKQMIPLMSADPSRGEALKAAATQAQAALKAQRLDEAENLVGQLEQLVGGGGAAPAAPQPPAPAAAQAPPAPPAPAAAQPSPPAAEASPALVAAPAVWEGTMNNVLAGIGKLKDTIRGEFKGEPPEVVSDIERNLQRLDQITNRFDSRLSDVFKQAQAAKDDAARKVELGKARALLAEHIKYVASEPLIALIDENPFGPSPNLKKTLVASLTQLASAVR